MKTQPEEIIAQQLAAKAGKPVSRFFRNEARRQLKVQAVEWHGGISTRKGDMLAAAIKREYRPDRF